VSKAGKSTESNPKKKEKRYSKTREKSTEREIGASGNPDLRRAERGRRAGPGGTRTKKSKEDNTREKATTKISRWLGKLASHLK